MGMGLLITANVQYGVFLLHLALAHLAEGQAVQVQTSPWLWPLNPLFRSLALINQRVDAALQREQLTSEYHERLLQQASESAAAEERNRIARELHDSIKQQIFSIRMSAVAAKVHVSGDIAEAQEALEDIQKSASEAQVEMQALLQQLRSSALENTSLAAAIRTQAEALGYRTGAQVAVEISDLPSVERFPPYMQEALFRIVQEGFANIARHARAEHVWCTLTQRGDSLEVVIKDDGQGFDMQHSNKGMGLANIQERTRSLDGTATIESESGKGTTIRVHVPLLISYETKQEKERRELESQRMLTRAQGGLQLSSTMATFTLLVIIASIALLPVRSLIMIKEFGMLISGFCLFIMLYGLTSAHPAIARVSIYRGEKDHETLSLRMREHLEMTSFLRLLLLVIWYTLLGAPRWHLALLWLVVSMFFLALLLLLLLVEYSLSNRAQNRYYTLLQGDELIWEVQWRWLVIRRRIILYIAIGIFIIVESHFSFFLPKTPGQVLASFGLMLFVIFWLGVLIDGWYLLPWRKLAKNIKQSQVIR